MPVAMETAADYVFRIIYPGHRHDNSKKLLCFDFSFYVDDGNFFGSGDIGDFLEVLNLI